MASPKIPMKINMKVIYRPNDMPKKDRLNEAVCWSSGIGMIPLFVVRKRCPNPIFLNSISNYWIGKEKKHILANAGNLKVSTHV